MSRAGTLHAAIGLNAVAESLEPLSISPAGLSCQLTGDSDARLTNYDAGVNWKGYTALTTATLGTAARLTSGPVEASAQPPSAARPGKAAQAAQPTLMAREGPERSP